MSAIPREERIHYVGASEIAAVCHQNPFKTRYEVWCEKKGLLEPENLDNKPAVRIGKALEDEIAEWWAEENGIEVRPYNEHHVHRDCPRYASSFDYITADGELVECKAPGYKAWRAWAGEPSLPHELQLQAEMDCAHDRVAKRAWLVILPLGEGVAPKGFPYEARPVTQDRMLAEVQDFWQSIDRNDPPQPDYSRDARAVLAARNALLKEGGLSAEPFFTQDAHMAERIARRQELAAEIKAATGEKKALDARNHGRDGRAQADGGGRPQGQPLDYRREADPRAHEGGLRPHVGRVGRAAVGFEAALAGERRGLFVARHPREPADGRVPGVSVANGRPLPPVPHLPRVHLRL